ncbi:MAG: 30S ribosomal protein S6e [Halobacteriales archaeon]|tara:strand:- start:3491 stop:3901 length:411 start_codon:yes stop_codon:yes gene_type:complete
MAEFQVVVGDPDTGNSYQFTVEGKEANRLIGKEIGDEVEGKLIGLDGYTLLLTGGSDIIGRQLNKKIKGSAPRKILITDKSGHKNSLRSGERKRITVRGREISEQTSQINTVVSTKGKISIEDIVNSTEETEEESG